MGGVPVVCMQGRVHLYEGHPVDKVVHGVRTMARMGVRSVLLTNAAGGLEPSWSAGDLMVGRRPPQPDRDLSAPRPERRRPRPALPGHDGGLRSGAPRGAGRGSPSTQNIPLRQGVYAALLGPSYETPAEVRMVRTLGAQAVGMSTVHEVIALRHMGVRVGALSCITNQAAGISPHPLDHAEVEATARARRAELTTLLDAVDCRGRERMP